MTTALMYWVEEARVDGFECVNASKVPLWYWESLRRKLDDAGYGTVLLADSLNESYYQRAFDKVSE